MVRITVLAVTVLCGGISAGCGGRAPGAATPHQRPTRSVVAWVDHPAAQVPVILRSPPYSTGARPCRPADLSVSHGQLGYATGNTNVQVYLTSRSATACWLDGYPTVAGVAANGTVTPLPARHGSFSGSPGPSAVSTRSTRSCWSGCPGAGPCGSTGPGSTPSAGYRSARSEYPPTSRRGRRRHR